LYKHQQFHVSGWKAVALAPLVVPAVLIVLCAQRFLGVRRTADLEADDVVQYLEGHLHGTGGAWDWDDFTSIPITDASLEAIRSEASAVDPSLRDQSSRDHLRQLLDRAKALASL
jgi:hypothetical protein